MRIALAQLNPIVGDIAGNTARVLDAMRRAKREAADLLITSELVLIGYPPRDLLLREDVVEACERSVGEIAREAGPLHVCVGHPRRAEDGLRGLRNSVSVCHDGRVIAVYDKQLLPGYDVFDEDRYFDPGTDPCIVKMGASTVALTICEDLWRAGDVRARSHYASNPIEQVRAMSASGEAGCDLLVALNASPFVPGKFQRHIEQLREVALDLRVPIVSVNQVGANDDLIFDGRSLVMNAAGQVTAMAPGFAEAVEVVEADVQTSDRPTVHIEAGCEPLREVYDALVLGVGDYCRKTGHEKAVIGLSGGIDSSVTAVIAADALGAENILAVLMPSKHTSAASNEDARALAANLGIDEVIEAPIHEAHDLMLRWPPIAPGSITDENIQARLRGMIIMAITNSRPEALALVTSNKSELAAGYSTLYGDLCGALAVLGDVLKTRVYDLARWINQQHEGPRRPRPPIPERAITRPPSAELRPNQTDQDTLPPYDVLDVIVERYIEREQSVQRIIQETDIDPSLIASMARKIDQAQFKREQAPVILKVSARAFGRGRPMPVVMRSGCGDISNG